MSQEYFAILTAIGEAKHANAAVLGTKVDYATMAVGDGNGVVPMPDRLQTALVHQVRRAPINMADKDPANPAQIIVEQVIPETEGGWWIREAGIFDGDGDLIAVANVPPTYKPQLAEGSGRNQVVRIVLLVANAAVVNLKIDPAVVLATRQYVDSKIDAIPAATTDKKGLIEIATLAEVKAGTDSERAVVPATLAAVLKTSTASVWDTIPEEHIGDIIFVKGIGEMWWVDNEWLTGYRTKVCGMLAQSFDTIARSWTLPLRGGTFDRTLPKYRGLYSWIMENGLMVPAEDYKDHEGFFGDLGGGIIKTPNQDDMFWRAIGTDRDTANARAVGSYQADQFRSHVHAGFTPYGNVGASGTGRVTGNNDASTGAAGGAETRGVNTAIAAAILI